MLALVLVALSSTPEPSMSQKLQALAAARVFVAHQSVGQNILDGVSVLALQHGVRVRIEEGRGAARFATAGIIHALVGKDGSPGGKLADFAALLEEGAGAHAQVVLLELSYADLGADTDVDALFTAFKNQLQMLMARFAATRFVVVTVGLTTVQRGLQGLLKNRMASGASGERENVKRHQFNELLRKHCAGNTTVLDLAAVQAGRCTFEREGRQWPCLREELTDDGGHLNALGRREAGRAFVDAVLAALQ